MAYLLAIAERDVDHISMKTVLLRIDLHQNTVCGHREANVIINNKCIFCMFRRSELPCPAEM